MILAPVLNVQSGRVRVEFNRIVVTGAGSAEVNTTASRIAPLNGKSQWQQNVLPRSITIRWTGDQWLILNIDTDVVYYFSEQDVEEPWLTDDWDPADGDAPLPTLTPFRT